MRFQGKVVVITGASRGIGRATALAFAKEGAKLVLACHERRDALQSLEKELPAQTEHISVMGDISSEKTVVSIADAAQKKFGRADVLINNAGGILGRGAISPDDFMRGMKVNLLGTILMTQAFAPLLKKQAGSSIINTSSAFGITGAAPVAVYTAAKAGVINYTKSMAVDLAPDVRVNAVAPSVIDTDTTNAAGPELVKYFAEKTPLGRIGTTAEAAAPFLFLASDDASYITGHTLVVDGGYMLVN